MRWAVALLGPLLLLCLTIITVTSEVEDPVTHIKSLVGDAISLPCSADVSAPDDALMLLVWYKVDSPVYSYDGRVQSEWANKLFNASGRVHLDLHSHPTQLRIADLTEDDQALYHCRIDFLLSPTINQAVNLTVVVLPSQPFILDEVGNKVEGTVGPYHEGDNLVLTCLAIGGRPPPHVSWYSGEHLVDATDEPSEIPYVRENELFLPLSRENAAPLSCRVSNTNLAPSLQATLHVELYVPAKSVRISWAQGTEGNFLVAGQRALATCVAEGSHPQPEISWWLDHKQLLQHITHQSWSKEHSTAESSLELIPGPRDDGAALSCVATNVMMAPSRGSVTHTLTLAVLYRPNVEIVKLGAGKMDEVLESEAVQLQCEVQANPPVDNVTWYLNDSIIPAESSWVEILGSGSTLLVRSMTRALAGRYSCSAANARGASHSEDLSLLVLYPPECRGKGVSLAADALQCHVDARPPPDTYLWRVRSGHHDQQQLTTATALLRLALLRDPLDGALHVECEANNGLALQKHYCEDKFSLAHLRPAPPRQCDMSFELEDFYVTCLPVENATHYVMSVWRLSSSNASLGLAWRGAARPGGMEGAAGLRAGKSSGEEVRGALGRLRAGDEAGAAACNRYGCSRDVLLRPSDALLQAAAPPWWHGLFEKDVGISLGVLVLMAVFVLSSVLLARLVGRRTRARTKPPVIQVLQLDDLRARDYLETLEHKRHTCSVRSCSSMYSGCSLEAEPPEIDRARKPICCWETDQPPPDVTLTMHRESAV